MVTTDDVHQFYIYNSTCLPCGGGTGVYTTDIFVFFLPFFFYVTDAFHITNPTEPQTGVEEI